MCWAQLDLWSDGIGNESAFTACGAVFVGIWNQIFQNKGLRKCKCFPPGLLPGKHRGSGSCPSYPWSFDGGSPSTSSHGDVLLFHSWTDGWNWAVRPTEKGHWIHLLGVKPKQDNHLRFYGLQVAGCASFPDRCPCLERTMDLKSGLSPTSFEWHDPRLGSTREATPPWVVQLSKISLDLNGLEGLAISAYIFGYMF